METWFTLTHFRPDIVAGSTRFRAVCAHRSAAYFQKGLREPPQLPAASRPAPGQTTVQPSTLACARLLVYQAMTDQGIKKAELARRLGWHRPQGDRLFDLRQASRPDQIEAAANALGKPIYARVA